MLVPNRNYSSPSYRYGFNGMEKDDNIKGNNNSYDFGARIYDPRIGRFNSIDPLSRKLPWYSPYLFAGNTPIMAGDADGLYPIIVAGKIVGYVIEPNQGPTQIVEDLNNPITQWLYGYCLVKPVTFEGIVKKMEDYYTEAGDWKESDMYDRDNPVYKDLNSNADEVVFFNAPKGTVESVKSTIKDIYSIDSDGLNWLDKLNEFLTPVDGIAFSDGGGGMNGFVKPRKGNASSWFDWNGALYDGLLAVAGRGKGNKGISNLTTATKRVADIIIKNALDTESINSTEKAKKSDSVYHINTYFSKSVLINPSKIYGEEASNVGDTINTGLQQGYHTTDSRSKVDSIIKNSTPSNNDLTPDAEHIRDSSKVRAYKKY